MRRFAPWAVVYILVCGVLWVRSQYTATYVPGNTTLPETSEEGQAGTNRCGEGSNDLSMCQNLYLNSATDFCLGDRRVLNLWGLETRSAKWSAIAQRLAAARV